ncbi:hypothetical protein [Methylobacterium sp. Leaf117]|uniref:hypothetical protein n=1 Tax=Methylobacterium sp. Leaf117 TaxID=1736260 RepID=UPI0006F27BE8|nr:hypothetical protein [Methylobacterium sp. Leaf117]KQP91667.1 hypothetical protein ASF57_03835 [Methylobacterium sp. Leaf117]
MIRASIRYFALAMAMLAAVTVKAVWEGGRWVLRSVRDSLRPPVGAGADIEDAFDGIAAKAESATAAVSVPAAESAVTAKPAPAPIPLDPILAKGRIATQYAHDMLNIDAEPTAEGLDEASAAWLGSLNASELMQIDRHGAHRVGSHMAGLRLIDGLPLTPTPAEYRSALCAAAQVTPEQRANVKEHEETLRRVIDEMLEQEPERYAPAM